jgi:hypothetical protein
MADINSAKYVLDITDTFGLKLVKGLHQGPSRRDWVQSVLRCNLGARRDEAMGSFPNGIVESAGLHPFLCGTSRSGESRVSRSRIHA